MTDISMKVKTPTVPNFLIIEMPPGKRQDGFMEAPKLRVGDLTDEQLVKLADDWKNDLLAKANKQRMGQ